MNSGTIKLLILIVAVVVECSGQSLSSSSSNKLVWKTRPEALRVVKENDNVLLNCEFEYANNKQQTQQQQQQSYFVIWYKDGSSQNVVALNDQLANPNATNYEIKGKYNLLIKNVNKNDSGQYTCQLFQSSELVATINLTVLVPPKYAKINVKQSNSNEFSKEYLVEGDTANLECCTNGDANPTPVFEWIKLPKTSRHNAVVLQNPPPIKSSRGLHQTRLNSRGQLCHALSLNVTRHDNNVVYKCSITNDATTRTIEDTMTLSVEYKPEVRVHLSGAPQSPLVKLSVLENSTIELYCNATASPSLLSYEWFVNDFPLRDFRTERLQLTRLRRNQFGNYTCKASNRHGSSRASFAVDIIYASLVAANKTSNGGAGFYYESSRVAQGAVHTTAVENASVILSCEIQSNPLVDTVTWYYYQVDGKGRIVNKVAQSNWITSINVILNETEKRYYSQLYLNGVSANQTGYYACSINFHLVDQLNKTKQIDSNATYFLQVQYAPIVRASKRIVYANDFDQVVLTCKVKSNPQSIFTWYHDNKELFTGYKHNITSVVSTTRRVNDFFADDYYQSTLILNSASAMDFGNYSCRASNIIGDKAQTIGLKRKQRPEKPIDFKVIETTATSVHLSWLSGSNGGENCSYVINVNQVYNLTTLVDHEEPSDDDDDHEDELGEESRVKQIELKGLQPDQLYEFKIMAMNSLGSSEFTSPLVSTRTQKATLLADKIPSIQNAQFNEMREAICFELEPTAEFILNQFMGSQQLKDLVVKIDVRVNDELLSAAQDLYRFNKTINLITDRNLFASTTLASRQKATTEKSALGATLGSLFNVNPAKRGEKEHEEEPNEEKKMPSSQMTRTFLISSSKLKFGQNCILYSDLIEMDEKIRNLTKSTSANNKNMSARRKSVFSLMGGSAQLLSTPSLSSSSASPQGDVDLSMDSLSRSFFDFKRLHKVNVTICYTNDSTICTQQINVTDYSTDFSTYVTFIAIGCSAILIFITLLIASLCCCCCKRNEKASKKTAQQKTELSKKLVIKSFPIVNTTTKNFDLMSDDSGKSSQHHILNGSGCNSSSSSHSAIFNNNSSGSKSSANEKPYFTNHANFIEQHMYDPNKYLASSYKIDFLNINSNGNGQNTSSIATVESDVSSSASLENKTSTTSNGASSKSSASPPFAAHHLLINENSMANYYQQPANYVNGSVKAVASKSQSLVYGGSNNIYIKTYQIPTSSMDQTGPTSYLPAQQLPIRNIHIYGDAPESGYSTPISNINNTNLHLHPHHQQQHQQQQHKKLVYEVIV